MQYQIKTVHRVRKYYYVEAESRQEARRKFDNDDAIQPMVTETTEPEITDIKQHE